MALSSPAAASRRPAFAALKASLESAALAAPSAHVEDLFSTTIAALDRLMGGGIPRGTLVTLEGPAGRWCIAARLIAAVTNRSTAAIIDDGGLYPPALAQAGARLERVLIVSVQSPLATARAADILLRARACRLVLMPAPHLGPAIWTRLSSLAHRTGAVLVAVLPSGTDAALPLAAAAAIRLRCTRERLVTIGQDGLWCTFCGYALSAELHKYKTAVSGARIHLRAVGDAVVH